ncbi:hypothetical protein V12B01_13320 [Vibrio splendidus 12B01]|nr:hypothetical protein V12B01_13320 [Vibrio splendidus 12B01]
MAARVTFLSLIKTLNDTNKFRSNRESCCSIVIIRHASE